MRHGDKDGCGGDAAGHDHGLTCGDESLLPFASAAAKSRSIMLIACARRPSP
jgi:hypothetical protein